MTQLLEGMTYVETLLASEVADSAAGQERDNMDVTHRWLHITRYT